MRGGVDLKLGFAFVTYEDDRDASDAVRDMHATGGSGSHEAIRDTVRRAARKVYARMQPKPMVVVTLREG